MIVCMTRKIAFDLYNLILDIRPNYKEKMQLIVHLVIKMMKNEGCNKR